MPSHCMANDPQESFRESVTILSVDRVADYLNELTGIVHSGAPDDCLGNVRTPD